MSSFAEAMADDEWRPFDTSGGHWLNRDILMNGANATEAE